MAAYNRTRSSDLASDVEVAGSLWGKFKGLMGRASLPAGQALWLDISPCAQRVHDQATAHMSESERAELTRLLMQVRDNLAVEG